MLNSSKPMIQAFCLQMGGRAPPLFEGAPARLKHHPASKKVHRAQMDPFSTCNAHVHWDCNCGGLRPPTPLLSFHTVHGLLSRTSRRQEELCQSHNVNVEVFQDSTSIIQAFCLQMVEAAPRCVVPRKLVSNIILAAKAEPIWTLSQPMMQTYIAPPPPPLSVYTVHGLLSRTLRHEEELRR